MSQQQPPKALYLGQQDFLAEFMFKPDILDEADYGHLDKNLSMTNLNGKLREPERARNLLQALHVLNNTNYFLPKEVTIVEGYDVEEFAVLGCAGCSSSYQVLANQLTSENVFKCEKCDQDLTFVNKIKKSSPVQTVKTINESLFPKTYHSLKARFRSFVVTASARGGHLIRSATTTHFSQSQSVEDRTKVKQNFWGLGKAGKTSDEGY